MVNFKRVVVFLKMVHESKKYELDASIGRAQAWLDMPKVVINGESVLSQE